MEFRKPMNTVTLGIALLAFAVLAGVGARAGHVRPVRPALSSADQEASGHVASVDLNKVYASSTAPHDFEQRALQVEQEAREQAKQIDAVQFLDENDIVEYFKLITLPAQDPAQQARMKALKASSDQRLDELTGLQSHKEYTTAERARMDQLIGAQKRFRTEFYPQILDTLQSEKKVQLDAFRQEQIANLRQIVEQVAKKKGITQVFDISALVYCANDLTSAVQQQATKNAGK